MLKKLCYLVCLFFVTVTMFLFGGSHANASVRYSNVQVSDVGSDNTINYGNTARKLAVSSDGTIYALFYGSNGIRVARSLDQGGSFQPSVQIDPANRQPEIAVSSNDVIYVAWTDTSGNVWLSRSTDKGVTFSNPQNIGSSGATSNSSLHMATDGNHLYILPKNGKTLFRSSDSGQQFSIYTFSTTFAYSDVHVDSRTGDVYIQKDNPTVYYFKSTDYGASFGEQQNGGGSIYYSVGTLSSGPNGTYLFVTGRGTTALRINLGDNTGSPLSFPNSSYNYGRSVLADEYGNVVTGYSDGAKVYYSLSNDLGNTFSGNNEVAATNMSNIGINPTNGDIMFLYASNGQIYLSTFKDELIGYMPNLSKSALYFDSSSMQQSVTITNTSSSPITIQDISISGEFTLTTTYGGTLDANESCEVTIRFSPTSAGSKTGALSITTSEFNYPRTVRLSGTAANAYAVTYNGNGNTGGSAPTDDTTYAEGVAVAAAGAGDLTRTGYTFAGWNTAADGSGTAYGAGATFNMGAGNVTLYAQWTANPTYNVTFKDYEGTTLKTETVDHGSSATAPADPARTGYTFTGWDTAFANVTGNLTVTAQYSVNQYTVSFNSNGGSAVDGITADHGTTITEPAAPTKEGYDFAGWYKEDTLTNAWAFDTDAVPAQDITLYAGWTIKEYTVTFKDYDGTTVKTESVDHGSGATAPADPARTGYTYTGWDTAFANVTGNLTVTAQYSVNQYTVSFDSSGGSAVDVITADYDSTITAPAAPTKAGYDFTGWYKEDTLTNAWAFDTDAVPAQDITLYAGWTIKEYTVTFKDYEGTTLKTETVDHGSGATAPADPARTGYTFTGWDTAFANVTGNLNVTAQYNVNQYTVSFDSSGGSAVAGITADYDSTITAPAAPAKAGYDFTGWYKEDTLTNAWAFDTDAVPAQDITLYAGWTIKEYTVTFKDYDGTTLKTETVDHGSAATAPADPTRTGYTFTGWDTAFANVTGNLTVTAQYSINQYTVSFNSNGGSTVDVITADYDSTITEPAAPTKEGYTFGGWYKEAELENVWDFGTDTVPAENITLYARWTANNYTVTYDGNGNTGGTVPTDGANYHYTNSVTVLGNTGNLDRRDYTFAGWNTAADGSGTDYAAADTFNMGTANVILYAQWTEDPSDNVSVPSIPAPATGGVDVIVNGKAENAGTATTTTEGDKTTTNIAVDEQKLDQKLASEGERALVTIPVNTKADVVIGELNGQMVKNMETKQAILEVKTETAAYTIPSKQINIDAISEQVGKNVELKDIKVHVVISKAADETIKIVENSAKKGDFTIVAPPMEFAVKYTHENKTVEVSNFNSYVERTVAIPAGVDPAKITTGVVVEADGTVRHVPTKIVVLDGKYYARINSLTNSTYSVVWHPKEFRDAEQHWAKEAINDLGSRMVISGVGKDTFMPDRDITRAEFAAIVVKALGLKQGTGKNTFADVKSTDWYAGFIETAYEQGIISGYGNGKFAPQEKITREQAMTMIARAMKITGLKVDYTAAEAGGILAEYGDSTSTAQWAKTSVASCIKAEIVTGKGGKMLALKDEITRAEVAVIVRILLQKSALI